MNNSKAWQRSLVMASLVLGGLLVWSIFAQTQTPAGQNPPLPTQSAATPAKTIPPDKVVMKVGDKQVTAADLDYVLSGPNPRAQRPMMSQRRRSFGEQYSLMLLLSQQALRDHLDSSPAFQRQMELARLQWLARMEMQDIQHKVQVTPEEVSQYYSAHESEFDEVKLRQAVIRKKTEGAKEGMPGLPPEEARTTAEAVRKALVAGKDAKQVSQELKVTDAVHVDAEPRTFRRGQLPAAWDRAVFQLKDGEVTEPLDTPQAIVLFQLGGQRHPELKEVSQQIENRLRQQKVQASIDELKKEIPIWMDQEYFTPAPPPVPATAPKTRSTNPPAEQSPASNPPPKP
jgi:hypothetical protein